VDDDDQVHDDAEALLHPAGSDASASGEGIALADYAHRAFGYFIDWVLVLIVAQVALSQTDFSIGAKMACAYGLRFVYATLLLTYLDGQTLGMKALGTRCVCDDRSTPLSLARAAYRQVAAELMAVSAAFRTLGAFGLVPPLADLLWPLWDSQNQTLHDKVAGTVVVR
jgi:uncharacterized RDD family membrane protein YckC